MQHRIHIIYEDEIFHFEYNLTLAEYFALQ